MVYGLGNKGGVLLRTELGDSLRPVSWGEKNRGVGRVLLEHALLVSDVMVAIELSCRELGIRLLHEEDLDLSVKPRPFQWRVDIRRGVIREEHIPFVVRGLRHYGGQQGYRLAAELCQ